MITGSVNIALDATVRLTLHDANGSAHEIEAVIDTGFNGFLTLPPALNTGLGLTWICRQQGQLAVKAVT
jgi:predicted aspartyl protease